jgi:hypothetical protein
MFLVIYITGLKTIRCAVHFRGIKYQYSKNLDNQYAYQIFLVF